MKHDALCAIDKPGLYLGMADCLINLASIDIEFGYYDEALRQLNEALILQIEALGKDDEVVRETEEKIDFLKITMGFHKKECKESSTALNEEDPIAETCLDSSSSIHEFEQSG